MISGKLSINLDFMFSFFHGCIYYINLCQSVFGVFLGNILHQYFQVVIGHALCFFFPPIFSGVFELNFMSNQPASGYYQFTVAVTGDSRLVANHVEVRWCLVA